MLVSCDAAVATAGIAHFRAALDRRPLAVKDLDALKAFFRILKKNREKEEREENQRIKNVFEARRPTIDVFVRGFTPNANSRASPGNSIVAARFSRTEKGKRKIIRHG